MNAYCVTCGTPRDDHKRSCPRCAGIEPRPVASTVPAPSREQRAVPPTPASLPPPRTTVPPAPAAIPPGPVAVPAARPPARSTVPPAPAAIPAAPVVATQPLAPPTAPAIDVADDASALTLLEAIGFTAALAACAVPLLYPVALGTLGWGLLAGTATPLGRKFRLASALALLTPLLVVAAASLVRRLVATW